MHSCRYILLLFCTLVLLIPYHLSGQQETYAFNTLGNLEDYSTIQTIALYQDSHGMLWIGTFQGLDRWDGHRILSYPNKPFDSLAIPTRSIGCIISDDHNNLWMLGDGLIKFDLEQEQFTPIPLYSDSVRLFFRSLKEDPTGHLWLGSGGNGIFSYNPENDSLRQIPLVGTEGYEIREAVIWDMIFDNAGRLWIMEPENGVFCYDREEDVFRQIPIEYPAEYNGSIEMQDIELGVEGELWIMGTRSELIRFDPESLTYTCMKLQEDVEIWSFGGGVMAIDKQGRIWYGVPPGLMRFDPRTGELVRIDSRDYGILVNNIMCDSQGNILIASHHGVRMVDMQESKIRTVSLGRQMISGGLDWFTCIIRDHESLWMGRRGGGLVRYNLISDHYQSYTANGIPGSLASNSVFKVLKDLDQRIWIMSGWRGILQRYDSGTDSFGDFDISPSRMITQDEEGVFWMLGLDRLIRFDPVNQDTAHIKFRKPLPFTVLRANQDYIPFIRDRQGIFWYAQGDDGLYRINPENGEWNHYFYDPGKPDGLPDIHIQSLFCDSQGTIWLSTWVGLSRIIPDPITDTAITFDNSYITEMGLGETTRITEDLNGNIWVGTLTGVVVFEQDGTIDKYTYRDGLPENQQMIWALNTDPENGNLYMGSPSIAIIPSDYLADYDFIPPVLFTGFWLGDQRIKPGQDTPLEKSILFADHIDLRYDQNFFRIDFSALDLSHPERNQYRYILKGVDRDTVYSGHRSYAEYTDLQPGKYTFWATGSNYTGLWNEKGKEIEIRIHPPWYRSMLAYIIYFLGIAGLIYGTILYRTRQLRMEKIRLEEEVESRTREIKNKNQQIMEMEHMKTRFFTDISHEIRTPLTLITGPVERLLQDEELDETKEGWLTSIKRNSQRLLQLVNQLLDIARLDAGHLKLVLEYGDILKPLRILVNGYQSLAETNHLRLVLDIPDDELINWFDRDKIEKITANLLSNALKYTPVHGIVTCRIRIITRNPYTPENPAIRIMVADNGHGIPENEKSKIFDRYYRSKRARQAESGGTGVGLAVTRELVDLLNGDLVLKSQEERGSVFIVTIPLGKDHLKEDEYIISEEKQQGQELELSTVEDSEDRIDDYPMTSDLKILVIDDNDEVRSFITDYLKTEYKIVEATDGFRGWEIATSDLPDLIITDIMMPGMDGFELCKKLKRDERTSHIPVVMLTARAMSMDRLEGLHTGADDYIIKPFSMEELSVRIRNLLEQRERLKDKYANLIKLNLGEMTVTSLDDQFLKKATKIISENLHDFRFDVSTLQDKMNMSSSNLYRKIKALTGDSPVQLLRNMRLKLAADLIQKNNQSITEVMLQVGFSNLSYFSRSFKSLYGVTPKVFQKSRPRKAKPSHQSN